VNLEKLAFLANISVGKSLMISAFV